MKYFLFCLFLCLSSVAYTQSVVVKEPVKTQLNSVLKTYLDLKNSLVASDSKVAQEKAQSLTAAITKVDADKLEGNQKEIFAKSGEKIKINADHIAKATSIDKQRESFSSVSDELFQILKAIKISDDKIYKDYCPMANDNNGAFWLSEKKEIANPYFGKQMLTCGEVKETL
jgi:membrane fusion protein, copper/silver efflux system